MDYSKRLSISYYKTIATLNESHKIYLVQHQETQKIYVKKILDVYNKDIYQYLFQNPINGIPQVVDLYEEENQLTIIENYVSGCSLQEILDASALGKTSVLNATTIYDFMMELCTILEQLHSLPSPIIHRDIKPSNIIITEHNHVMLLDFNAAKYFTNADSNDTVLLGTQGYAAPEQYGFGSSTPRTDIYALGILLKELTTSLHIPSKYDTIIAKCIQINPEDRYQSVAKLKVALKQLTPPAQPKSSKMSSTTVYNPYLPPGFRNKTPWKMLFASIIYLFIFWLSLSLEVKNMFGMALWVERIFCLFIFLSFILVGFNYLDIQKCFPLCKHRNRFLHYAGIVILETIFITILLVTMSIILDFFSYNNIIITSHHTKIAT